MLLKPVVLRNGVAQLAVEMVVVVKVAFKDEFAGKLLANELHFNRKLRNTVPEHHGRRWAAFIGSCRIPNNPDFLDEVPRKQVWCQPDSC